MKLGRSWSRFESEFGSGARALYVSRRISPTPRFRSSYVKSPTRKYLQIDFVQSADVIRLSLQVVFPVTVCPELRVNSLFNSNHKSFCLRIWGAQRSVGVDVVVDIHVPELLEIDPTYLIRIDIDDLQKTAILGLPSSHGEEKACLGRESYMPKWFSAFLFEDRPTEATYSSHKTRDSQNACTAQERNPTVKRGEGNTLNWGERKFSISQKCTFWEALRLTDNIIIFRKRS